MHCSVFFGSSPIYIIADMDLFKEMAVKHFDKFVDRAVSDIYTCMECLPSYCISSNLSSGQDAEKQCHLEVNWAASWTWPTNRSHSNALRNANSRLQFTCIHELQSPQNRRNG